MKSELLINPFEGIHEQSSETDQIITSIDESVEQMFQLYKSLKPENKFQQDFDMVSALKVCTLKPPQINQILQKMINFEIKGQTAGFYITRLLQESFNNGYNNFFLTTNDSMIPYIGYTLAGTDNNPARITINGNSGTYTAEASSYCSFIVVGNADIGLGNFSKHTKYKVTGNTIFLLGYETNYCEYEIMRDTGFGAASFSKHSTYTFHGKVGEKPGEHSEDCCFRTYDFMLYRRLLKQIPVGHKIQLLNENGKVTCEEK